jgi:hypothetical protein
MRSSLLDIPVWSFEWQLNYMPVDDIRIERGDIVRFECWWDRSLVHFDEPRYVTWNEGTVDEMCYSSIRVIPIPSPVGTPDGAVIREWPCTCHSRCRDPVFRGVQTEPFSHPRLPMTLMPSRRRRLSTSGMRSPWLHMTRSSPSMQGLLAKHQLEQRTDRAPSVSSWRSSTTRCRSVASGVTV